MNAHRLAGRHSRSTRERTLIFVALGVLLVTTSGCGTPAPSAASRTVVSSPSTTSRAPTINDPDALHDWIAGASTPSYQQSSFWRRAASSLSAAAMKDPVRSNADRRAALELLQLASLPETSDTPAQKITARRDVRDLNTFFRTKNLYQ